MKRVAGLIAAAGFGRRYGSAPKLHAPLDGRPILAWTIELLARLPLAQRLVVVAPGDDEAEALARAAGVRLIVNPDPARGLGSSIACGARALGPEVDGLLVMLGDMPRIRVATCTALLARFEALDAEAVLAPCHAGRRGHPVLFGAAHIAALCDLKGDEGARSVLATAALTPVEVDDPGVLLDIDTPADLAAAVAAARD